jgi:hypothetical protein
MRRMPRILSEYPVGLFKAVFQRSRSPADPVASSRLAAFSMRRSVRKQVRSKENGPMRGHFRIEACASIIVMVVLDDHHPVVMMPAVIAMFAILGACATIAIAVPDDDGFGTGDRRGRDSNGNNRRDDISKLLHDVLLLGV